MSPSKLVYTTTDRESSGGHLDGHAAEQDRSEAGTRADVVVSEWVLTVHQQLATVFAVIVCQLRPTYRHTKPGKVLPYSLPSVGPAADPAVRAVSSPSNRR